MKIVELGQEYISKITYLNEFIEEEHESIIECLNDERCNTIQNILFSNLLYSKGNIYLTPHFLNHFELQEQFLINDYQVIKTKYIYAAHQLGFELYVENIKRTAWEPLLKFYCLNETNRRNYNKKIEFEND